MDQKLREFATEKQWTYYLAVNEHGSQKAASRALGINQSTIGRSILALKKKAAAQGYSPEHGLVHHPAAPGFISRGHSTLYDSVTGEAKLQWHKTQRDEQQAGLARQAALEAMLEEIPPAQPIEPVALVGNDLLNLYILTDYHLGMLAWGEETGEDWNIKIAEKLLIDWFTAAIAQAPQADVAIFCQLGDFLHFDGLEAITPVGRNLLDSDTKFQNIVRVAVRATKQIIAMLRAKYNYVHVIMADANHDPAGGAWLREMLASTHQGDDSITVDTSPDTYYCYSWGETSLFFHHGHKRKPTSIEGVFAAKFRDVWGSSKHSYAHLGHMHHLKALEGNLMIVEQHRTLAAKDAYSSSRGFLSGRSASVITYRKQHGEVGRVTLTPEMVTPV